MPKEYHNMALKDVCDSLLYHALCRPKRPGQLLVTPRILYLLQAEMLGSCQRLCCLQAQQSTVYLLVLIAARAQ